jgi:hypothetical protein
MRTLLDQLFQSARGDLQIPCDAVKLGAINLAKLVQLASVCQPACESGDQLLEVRMGSHGVSPVVCIIRPEIAAAALR